MALESNPSAEADLGKPSAAETTRELKTLKQDMQVLKEDLKNLLAAMKSDGSSRLGDAKDRLIDMKERAKAGLQTACANVQEQTEKVAEAGREKIRERPLTIVAAALVAGIVLGRFLRRG